MRRPRNEDIKILMCCINQQQGDTMNEWQAGGKTWRLRCSKRQHSQVYNKYFPNEIRFEFGLRYQLNCFIVYVQFHYFPAVPLLCNSFLSPAVVNSREIKFQETSSLKRLSEIVSISLFALPSLFRNKASTFECRFTVSLSVCLCVCDMQSS